jgi:carboxypeptidase Q
VPPDSRPCPGLPRRMFVPGLLAAALALAPATPIRAATANPAPAVPADVAVPPADAARIAGAALASDRAWRRLSELCDGIGHRLSGSAALDRAVAWARAAMVEDGLDSVWLQPVKVPRWVRGQESATLVEPMPLELPMLGLGRSVGTPKGGITAPVVAVSSFDEMAALPPERVRGRIVLWNVPFTTYGQTVRYRSRGANEASRRGAVASLVRAIGPTGLRTPHTGNMAAYNDSFPRIPGAALSAEDTDMIQRLLDRGTGVKVRLSMQADTLPDGVSHNVIGELRGRERPDEIVVVGGHLDSWDVGQGAHDDGGGCVIAMESLRLLKELGLRPRRTLRVVLWTNEENGARGAKAYADSIGTRQRHVAAIESDGGVERVVGFGFRLLKAGTDSTDAGATARLVERARPLSRLLAGIDAAAIDGDGGGTDIEPLMKLGVPGIAHQTTMERYFQRHHTAADVMSHVDPLELRRNVAAFAIMSWALAEMPGTLVP